MEPSTAYYSQTDSQTEIVNIEFIQATRDCKAEENEWVSKILEIPLRLNLHYNATPRNNHFITVLGFDNKL